MDDEAAFDFTVGQAQVMDLVHFPSSASGAVSSHTLSTSETLPLG